ncbi:MAG: hypothetical protein QXO51_07160 [Halobacteria archaeon]
MAAGTAAATATRRGASTPIAPLALAVASVGLALAFGGLYWDGVWHTTVPFEEFWSPPHLVLYAGLALVLIVNLAIFHPPFREAFGGTSVQVPFVSFRLPAPLVLLAAGSLMAIFSGMADQKWHETLKGGESAYSLPHNFTILGGMLAALAVCSAFLLLQRRAGRVANKWAVAVFAAVLVMVMYRLTYSFAESQAGVLRAMADPVLASDPQAQALRQRYLETNLLADNTVVAPVFLVVAALLPLSFARGLTGDRWAGTRAVLAFAGVGLALTALFWLQGYRPVRSTPVALAVLPAGIAADLVFRARSHPATAGAGRGTPPLASPGARSAGSQFMADSLPWLVAAAAYLACYGALFGLHPAGVALALGGGWLAGFMGRGLAAVTVNATPRAVGWTLLWMGLVVPVALSGLDFYLRWPLLR